MTKRIIIVLALLTVLCTGSLFAASITDYSQVIRFTSKVKGFYMNATPDYHYVIFDDNISTVVNHTVTPASRTLDNKFLVLDARDRNYKDILSLLMLAKVNNWPVSFRLKDSTFENSVINNCNAIAYVVIDN